MTNLPDDFISRMKEQLGSEADAFFASYQQPKAYGLRINPLKYQQEDCNKNLPFTLTPVAWAKEGFYAVSEEHPGRHPLHEGGAYYIQEPSAMSVVSLLAPEPGDIICDLCAAPGGKSTQIAGRLLGEGLLVSNEIFLPVPKFYHKMSSVVVSATASYATNHPTVWQNIFHSFFTKS